MPQIKTKSHIPTHDRGIKSIYTYLVTESIISRIKYFTLTHNNIRYKSDHKSIILDIDRKKLFENKLDKMKVSR